MIKLILASALIFNLYPQTFVVGGVDYDTDIVTIVDSNNNEFEFFGCEDWQEGDIVSAIMNDNGTPNDITDDIIVKTKYSGWVY